MTASKSILGTEKACFPYHQNGPFPLWVQLMRGLGQRQLVSRPAKVEKAIQTNG